MSQLTVAVSTTIERSRDDVYALVADLRAHERWTDHFLTDWKPAGDGVSVKLKGGGRSEIHPVSSTPDAVIEEGSDGKRRTRGTYTLRPMGPKQTEVTFTNEILERGSKLEAALADPLVKALLKRNNAKALARLKEILED